MRVYQFRHPSLQTLLRKQRHFFAGDAAGEALAAGEAVVVAPLAGLAEAAGLAAGDAAGDAGGAAAGFAAGEGCFIGDAPSLTTDEVPKPGMEKSRARNMKIIAATTVAFSSGFWAPRGPKAV